MEFQQLLDRINELSRKSRTPEGLTPEETEERARLRKMYLEQFRAGFQQTLDNTYIQTPDGKRTKIQPKNSGIAGQKPGDALSGKGSGGFLE